MSDLPNIALANVPVEKVRDYLLSFSHRAGRAKAAFFTRFGFTADAPEELAQALIRHAAGNGVARDEASPFGVRYVVEGPMATPDGRTPLVRSVWFIDHGDTVPRFITAYPLR